MKGTIQVETWLPCFDGFYGTLWEPDEEYEMENVNSVRREKGWKELDYDAFEFDYDSYRNDVVRGIINELWNEFPQFVSDIDLQQIRSPRYYNFSNDAADIVVTLTEENRKNIGRYIARHKEAFQEYLRDHYTSRSGFISHYSPWMEDFMEDKPLEHPHKLGSILQFIFQNEGMNTETLYYSVEAYLFCLNYKDLISQEHVELERA